MVTEYGSGKTFCGSLLGILLCKKYPGIRGLVGAKTFPMVRDTTLVSYFEHLDNLGYKKGVNYEYQKAESKIVFKNGSEILFRYLDDESKIKSLNLGFVELEEASEIPENTFKQCLGRLRQEIKPEWKNFKYRLFMHTNPMPNKGWIYKYFVKEKKTNYRRIIAPSTQNVYLPDSFIQGMKDAYDEDYFKINVLGLDGDYSKGLLTKGFINLCELQADGTYKVNPASNIRPITYLPEETLHLTADFNRDPNSWELAHKSKEKAFFFDELVLEDSPTENSIKIFIEKYADHKGPIIINGDSSGFQNRSEGDKPNFIIMQNKLLEFGQKYNKPNFKRTKLDIQPSNPYKKWRRASWNAKIRNSNGDVGIYIDPKCKWLIYNCENLMMIPGTDDVKEYTKVQIEKDPSLKFLGHPYDAASYMIFRYWPVKRKYDDIPATQQNIISEHNFNHLLKR